MGLLGPLFLNKKEVKMKQFYKIGGMIAGSMMVLVIIAAIMAYTGDYSNWKIDWKSNRTTIKIDMGTSEGAIVWARKFVKQRLLSPSTADFPWLPVKIYSTKNKLTYFIYSYVDSQNGFGAMIRTNYSCQVRYLGDGKWKCIDIEFF